MIVGSGIVGSYLGSRIGDCEIWEKNSENVEKACSGVLSVSGIKSIKLNIDGCVQNELKGAIINEKLRIERKKPVAYVLDRLQLQKNAIQDAENAGCKIKYNKEWNGQEDDFIIGADGALSAVAASEGIKRKFIRTYQVETDYKSNPEFVKIFLNENSPGFFSWIIPVNEKKARIGLGTTRGNPKQLLKKQFPKVRIQKEQAGMIPVFDGKKTVFGNKALVGDAAAQMKTTTGGGIIFGCKCAEDLKTAIDKEDLMYYEKKWRKNYEFDLRLHKKIRNFLNKVDKESFFSDLKNAGMEKTILKYGDMDHPIPLLKNTLPKLSLWKYLPEFLFS